MPSSLPAWLPDRPTAEAWLRQWWISVVSGALILVTAVTVLVVMVSRDTERPADASNVLPATATESASPDAEEPAPAATTSASPTPKPSPTPRRTSAAPVDRLAAWVRTVQRLVESDDLDRREGRELQRTAATIAVAIQEGRTERAVQRLRELDERLRDLREDDELSRAGYEELDVLEPIIASLR
jgi:hypothetical protein